jgi:hypothetical protein
MFWFPTEVAGRRPAPLILVGALVSVMALGQTYETGRQVKMKGAVTRIDWAKPRAYIFINVKDAAGPAWLR